MAARHRTTVPVPPLGERRHLDRRAPVASSGPRAGAALLVPLLVAVGIVGFIFVMSVIRPDLGVPSALERRETLVVVAAVMVLVAALLLVSVATRSRRAQRGPSNPPSVDRLTGLVDRRGLAAAARAFGPGASWIAEVDLDRFKPLNDAFGHSVGDALLRRVASILTDAAATIGGVVGRLEGDLFAIAIPAADAHDVDVALLGIVEDLRHADVDDRTMELGCSIGVTHAAAGVIDDERFAGMLDEADLAMYRAKRLGRGRVVHLDDTSRDALARFRAGTFSDTIDVGVRLQRSLGDRSIAGAGVIAQLHPAGSEPLEGADLQLVAEFAGRRFGPLDVALVGIERSGRTIPPVGIRLWFPVSAGDLVAPGGVDALWSRLAKVGLSGTPLGVELVDAHGQDPGPLAVAIAGVHARGVEVAVPVTGDGAVALSDLARLRADRFVVDAGVVEAVYRDDREMQGVVRAVAELGTQLGAEVIAVGVNTIDAAHRLGELGVSVAQVLLTEPWAPQQRRRGQRTAS